MKTLQLTQKEFMMQNGDNIRLVYDEEGDTLEIFFGENESATGIELTDHIVLRLNRTTARAVSLTLLHFSILTERTKYGPRSYPLCNLDELPEDLQDAVIRVITAAPVDQFLKVSYFQASQTERVPFTYVEPFRFAQAA